MTLDDRIPAAPGVYLVCFDGRPYYVGASMNIRARLRQHIRRKRNNVGSILDDPRGTAHVLEIVGDVSELNAAEVKWSHRLHTYQVIYPHHGWRAKEEKR